MWITAVEAASLIWLDEDKQPPLDELRDWLVEQFVAVRSAATAAATCRPRRSTAGRRSRPGRAARTGLAPTGAARRVGTGGAAAARGCDTGAVKSEDTPFEGGPMDGRVLPVLLGPTGHPPKTYRIPVPDADGGPPTVLVYRRVPRGQS